MDEIINLPVYKLKDTSKGMFKVFCEVKELNLSSEADGKNKKNDPTKIMKVN